MAMMLIHMAEACHFNNLHQDAIRYELRGLDIYKELFGKESENYVAELNYLKHMYYLQNQWQLLAYFCGCTEFALEQQQKDFSPEMHIAAMKRALEHYKANRTLTGIVAEMETLSNLEKNGKLEETLRQDAQKILKNMEKAEKKE